MSKEQLTHIFEPSACLSPRQLKGYASGKMVHEECHAVEVHLLSCPFCSEAVEGLKAANSPAAIAAMEKLDDSFIAKHFGVPAQEIKQVTKSKPVIKAGAYSNNPETKEKKAVRIPWKPLSLAATLVAAVCIMWFMRDSIFPQGAPRELAQQATIEPVQEEPEIVYRPAEDTMDAGTTVMADTITTMQQDIAQPEPLAAVTEDAALQKKPPVAKDTAGAAAKALLAKKEADKKLAEAKAAEAKLASAKKAEADKNKLAAAANKEVAKLAAENRGRMGNSYTPTSLNDYSTGSGIKKVAAEEAKVTTEPEAAPAKKKIELGTARSGILKGDEAFNDGKYKKALKLYQKVMYDPESNQKDAATLMAAKCHIAMDEMMQARTLLNSLVQENSTKKDEANGLLNKIKE